MTQAHRARSSSRARLFAAAERACQDLREHIAGTKELTPAELEAAKGLVRKASKESFYFFAKVVLGFSKMMANPHKRWADDLQAKWLGCDAFARLKPRGTFKTTLYGEAFPLWIWATVSREIRFLYTSANASLLREVANHLDHYIGMKADSLYATVWDIRRDPDAPENTASVFNITGRDAGAKGSSLIFRTAGGATNGLHPHFIIVDDPCDQDDRSSEACREGKKRWFDSLQPLLVPFEWKVYEGGKLVKTVVIKKMMLIATRWHLQDVIAYAMGQDDWDFEIEGVYDQEGKPAYPEFMPEDAIAAIKKRMSDIFFACQYLNNPLPEGHRVFEEASLHFMRREQVDLMAGTTYCFFDPSQGKSGGDYPAVIWVNILNGRKVVFDAIDEKIGLTMLIAMIATRNQNYRAKAIIFETNGAMTMENTLVQAHKAIKYDMGYMPIHETRNKEERIQAIQPDLYNGSWFLPDGWEKTFKEMRNQIIMYPAWGHDDFPDVLEKAVSWVAINMPGSFSSGSGGSSGRKTLGAGLKQSSGW